MPQKDRKKELTDNYDSIKVMKGLPYLRKRAYVNMGSTSSVDGKMPRALIQMAQEILSNSIDEAQSGFGNEINVTIHKDESLTVADHGRGLPRDLKTKDKDGNPKIIKFGSAVKAFTEVGASGKFSNSAYGVGTGGLNGIGATATTALSEWVEVEAQTTNHEHYKFRIDYDEFIKTHEPTYEKELDYDDSKGTYTKVTFKPDKKALDSINWQVDGLANRYEMSAYLIPKTKITLTDERNPLDKEHPNEPWHKEWYSENGLVDYTKALADGAAPVKGLGKPITFEGEFNINKDETTGVNNITGKVDKKHVEGTIYIHGAFLWIENIGLTTASFANGIPTTEGGPHLDGALQAIVKQMNEYISKKKLLPRGAVLDASDIKDGLILTVEAKIPENLLQFEGQTKEKLGTGESKKAAKEVVTKAFDKWLYSNEKIADGLVDKMNESKVAREKQIEARKEAQEARKAKAENKHKLMVSSKLKTAVTKDPKKRELFIVEGDSAAGTIIQARNKNQAVFPLRGKILNVEDRDLKTALHNQEISTITAVLGAGIGAVFDPKELEYDKVIILTDADDDGMHIRSLVTTLFFKFFPKLIEDGHLFVAEAPLFKISREVKNRTINEYSFSNEDKDKIVEDWKKQGFKGIDVQRFKGLGENSAEDLKKTVVEPGKRNLLQLTNVDVAKSRKFLQINMGNDADLRRDWVMEHMDLNDSEEDMLND